MNRKSFYKYCSSVFCGLALALPFGLVAASASLASPQDTYLSVKPPVSGAPGGRTSGGSRNPGCLGNQPLTALIPQSTTSLTASRFPTVMVYVPTPVNAPAEFVLQDENRQTVYRTTLQLNGQSGVTSVTVPAGAAPELEAGKQYHWFLMIVCDADAADAAGHPFVRGSIQRVETPVNFQQQVQQAAPSDRVALYQKAGLLYDALSTLAELRRTQPDNAQYQAQWQRLLASLGLEPISQAPVVSPLSKAASRS